MVTLLAIIVMLFLVLKSHFYCLEVNTIKIAEELKRQAEDNGLLPGRTLIRKNLGLALDRTQSYLIYATIAEHKLVARVLDLSKVKYCNILHIHSQPCSLFSIRGTKNKKYLDGILLNIQYADSNYQIPFYNYRNDKLSKMKIQSRQARQWQRIINNKSVFSEICKD